MTPPQDTWKRPAGSQEKNSYMPPVRLPPGATEDQQHTSPSSHSSRKALLLRFDKNRCGRPATPVLTQLRRLESKTEPGHHSHNKEDIYLHTRAQGRTEKHMRRNSTASRQNIIRTTASAIKRVQDLIIHHSHNTVTAGSVHTNASLFQHWCVVGCEASTAHNGRRSFTPTTTANIQQAQL